MSKEVFPFRLASNNKENRRAWKILSEVPEGQRNNYIVQAILERAERETLETTLRRVLQEELREVALDVQPKSKSEPKQDVPQEMTNFLAGFMNQ